MDLNLEYGACQSDCKGSSSDKAYHILVSGDLSKGFSYYLEKIFAGPRYFGYYSDNDFTYGTFLFPLFKRLQGNFSFRSLQDNLSRDPARFSANSERSWNLGLTCASSNSKAITPSLSYEDYVSKDVINPLNYNFATKRLRLGLSKSLGKFNIQTYYDYGSLNDFVLRTTQPMDRLSVYCNFNPSTSQTISMYLLNGYDSFYLRSPRTKTVGLSTSMNLRRNLNMNVALDRYESPQNSYQNRLSTNINYSLPNGTYFNAQGQFINSGTGAASSGTDTMGAGSSAAGAGSGNSSFFITYNVPVGIPVEKKRDIGSIRGMVYNGDKPGKTPIVNAIIMANNVCAVTNGRGEFLFPSLKPGDYYITVDKASVGIKKVVNEKMPLIVTVTGGASKTLSLPVVTSCTISGRVVQYAPGEGLQKEKQEKGEMGNPPLSDKGGLACVLMSISDGKGEIRQFTDNEGAFYFENLRPGTWKLSIVEDYMPELSTTERESYQAELKPGERQEIVVKVIPRKRVIKIIDKGEVKTEKKK